MATEPMIPPPPPDPTPGLSEPARIINTFIAPSKTFTDLRRNAMWWGPLVLMILVSLAFTYSVDSKIGFRKVVDDQIALSPKAQARMEQVPADQREQQLGIQVTITKVISYAFPAILLIITLISSAVMFAFFKFAANADLSFKRMFAVSMYASVPGGLKYLFAAVVIFMGGSQEPFNMNNPIGTNLGFFLDPTGNKAIYTMASSIDIFTIWTLMLTVIGVCCVSNVKRNTAYIGVFGWTALIVLLFSGLALLG